MGYIEDCLRGYKKNVALIQDLSCELENLCSVHGQNYNRSSGTQNINDPVYSLVFRKMVLERRILKLKDKTIPISKLIENLTGTTALHISQIKSVLELHYLENKSLRDTARELGLSKDIVWRRSRDVILMAHKFFKKWDKIL